MIFRALIAFAALCVIASSGPAGAETLSGKFEAAFSSFTGRASLKGGWRLVEADGRKYIEFSEDFRARSAPDLKLFLSPLEASAVTGGNATEASVRLGLLKSNTGVQRFEIPADTDLEKIRSVVVHCEQYSKLWGTSPLR